MKFYKIILLFIIATSVVGCELAVNVPVPYEGDKVVVNGIQRDDSVWHVDLSRSMNILSPIRGQYFELPNAEVLIYHPDGSAEVLEKVNYGNYEGKTMPVQGEKYKIVVNSTGFESVNAEMTMPFGVPIIDVKWDSTNVRQVPPTPNGPLVFQNIPFEITINDPGETKNYYAIKIFQLTKVTYQIYPSGTQTDTILVEKRAYIKDLRLVDKDEFTSAVSDEMFNGKTFSIKAQTQLVAYQNEEILRIDVSLINSSEETYEYERTLKLQREVAGDPFAQPVPVYSNVNGGLGIFSGNTAAKVSYYPKREE